MPFHEKINIDVDFAFDDFLTIVLPPGDTSSRSLPHFVLCKPTEMKKEFGAKLALDRAQLASQAENESSP